MDHSPNCEVGIHTRQRSISGDADLIVTVCRDCGTTLYSGPRKGLREWMEGGPAPWARTRNGPILPGVPND